MDVFDKCRSFTAAKEVMSMGYYPYFHMIESGQDSEVTVEGKKMIMIGSNNYLGLTSHHELIDATIKAIKQYGVGCVGSRFLNGTLKIHLELEEKLAGFMKQEAAIVFSTGMQANLGVISALAGKGDYLITDKYDHASIIDGCRLSFSQMKRFKHNDIKDLERVLETVPADAGKLIIVDGVFSMEGDIADLPGIIDAAKKYGARIIVDDAHGIGVIGRNGRGTAEHFGCEKDIDLIIGTFSKAFATVGGFVAGKEEIIHYLKHHARSLIFSASLPPGCVATVISAIDIIEREPERRSRLLEISERMRGEFVKMGFDTGTSITPIIPIVIGSNMKAFQMWRMLFDRGVFTTPIVSPAVPENRALIRTSYMATHTDRQLDTVLEKFEEVGLMMGIIKGPGRTHNGGQKVEEKLSSWMKKIWRSRE